MEHPCGASAKGEPRMRLKLVFRFFASYGLSCILFLMLFLLTFLGTLYQADNGLYEAQKKYFESFYLIHWAFDEAIPIPMLGGYAVMALLAINMTLGGFVRARIGWVKTGVIITHLGIVLLLVGSVVTYHASESGYLKFAEGETKDHFVSFYDWEIAVSEHSNSVRKKEYIVPQTQFVGLQDAAQRRFLFADLPFEFAVSGYAPNARARQAAQESLPAGTRVAEGYHLVSRPKELQAESNLAGAYGSILSPGGEVLQEGILWAGRSQPFTFELEGRRFTAELRHRRFPLPFALHLDTFSHEFYPGTGTPKVFRSDVTKIEGGSSETIEISMNKPLRHLGYTFYQSSYGKVSQGGEAMYSQLSVVRNPTDQWPLYACLVITLGMALHFAYRLSRHLKREHGQRHEQ
jgi:hypothetical protein